MGEYFLLKCRTGVRLIILATVHCSTMTALRLPFDLFKAAPLCPTQLRLVSRVPVAISRRYASTKKPKGDKKKKKARSHYLNQPLSKGIQFSLCDAIRYGLVLKLP